MKKRFALLIDAENISIKYADLIIKELTKRKYYITIKRAYADFTNNRMTNWKQFLLNNSISPIHQYSYVKGKNSSDIALIIDAMDILYNDNIDNFIIVTSDSDFTHLVIRLRESNKCIIGFGRSETSLAFRNSCDEFISYEYFEHEINKKELNTIKNIIIKYIISNLYKRKHTNLSQITSILKDRINEFSFKRYGFTNATSFFLYFSCFEIYKINSTLYLKIKKHCLIKYKLIMIINKIFN